MGAILRTSALLAPKVFTSNDSQMPKAALNLSGMSNLVWTFKYNDNPQTGHSFTYIPRASQFGRSTQSTTTAHLQFQSLCKTAAAKKCSLEGVIEEAVMVVPPLEEWERGSTRVGEYGRMCMIPCPSSWNSHLGVTKSHLLMHFIWNIFHVKQNRIWNPAFLSPKWMSWPLGHRDTLLVLSVSLSFWPNKSFSTVTLLQQEG